VRARQQEQAGEAASEGETSESGVNINLTALQTRQVRGNRIHDVV
jgi:hypothetical protein